MMKKGVRHYKLNKHQLINERLKYINWRIVTVCHGHVLRKAWDRFLSGNFPRGTTVGAAAGSLMTSRYQVNTRLCSTAVVLFLVDRHN